MPLHRAVLPAFSCAPFCPAVLLHRFAPLFCPPRSCKYTASPCRFVCFFLRIALPRCLSAFSCAPLCLAVLPAAGLKQKRAGENADGIDSAARVCYNRMRKTITKSGRRRSSPPPAAVFRGYPARLPSVSFFVCLLRLPRLACLLFVPVCRMRCVRLPFASVLCARPARLPFAAPSALRRFPPVQKQRGLQSSSSSINS